MHSMQKAEVCKSTLGKVISANVLYANAINYLCTRTDSICRDY